MLIYLMWACITGRFKQIGRPQRAEHVQVAALKLIKPELQQKCIVSNRRLDDYRLGLVILYSHSGQYYLDAEAIDTLHLDDDLNIVFYR